MTIFQKVMPLILIVILLAPACSGGAVLSLAEADQTTLVFIYTDG